METLWRCRRQTFPISSNHCLCDWRTDNGNIFKKAYCYCTVSTMRCVSTPVVSPRRSFQFLIYSRKVEGYALNIWILAPWISNTTCREGKDERKEKKQKVKRSGMLADVAKKRLQQWFKQQRYRSQSEINKSIISAPPPLPLYKKVLRSIDIQSLCQRYMFLKL